LLDEQVWKDEPMPKPYPREFHDDVVKVARGRPDGVTLDAIANDFGIYAMTLSGWIKKADVEDGKRPGTTAADSAELRDAKKRIRLLEQENEVLRRVATYLGQANLPKG
jgi:transposase